MSIIKLNCLSGNLIFFFTIMMYSDRKRKDRNIDGFNNADGIKRIE
jgi:hypothetical protein